MTDDIDGIEEVEALRAAVAERDLLRAAVTAYHDALIAPADTSRGCVEACEARRVEMFALVGVEYRATAPRDTEAPNV